MQSDPRTIVILGTGGTIAGRAASPDDDAAYTSAVLPVDRLLAGVPAAGGVVTESEQVAQIDSKDMDFAVWRRLAEAVTRHLARAEVRGVVVTHGTDTLEESAYFLARVVAASKPVVLTAAMRPASSREADGPRNLADAIAVAATASEPGVVVVLAGVVHAARAVRKVHPTRLDAFSSGEQGGLARVVDGAVVALRAWPGEAQVIGLAALPEDPAAWPWVEIVTGVAGADGRAVDLLVQGGVAGIVVAATGNGTLHRRLEDALVRARSRGVAVLRSTRCLDGALVAAAGAALAAAGDLTPVKARVELILTLLRAVAMAPARG
jgi:L-asparaginase